MADLQFEVRKRGTSKNRPCVDKPTMSHLDGPVSDLISKCRRRAQCLSFCPFCFSSAVTRPGKEWASAKVQVRIEEKPK